MMKLIPVKTKHSPPFSQDYLLDTRMSSKPVPTFAGIVTNIAMLKANMMAEAITMAPV